MKRIFWFLEGCHGRKVITARGAGVQQAFAELSRQDRWDITIFGTRVIWRED